MKTPTPDTQRPETVETLQARNQELAIKLEEAQETIRAIHQGSVDAFVLEREGELRVYTLEGADRPYRLFVEHMRQGVATLHEDGTILYCNQRLADMLQVPHAKLTGASLHDFVVPSDRARYASLLRKGKKEIGEGEVQLQRLGGELLPVCLTFTLMPDDSGSVLGLFVTDMTTEKHHERLAAAQEALHAADRRKNEFLAILSHELRNPLAPIRNAVDILRLQSGDKQVVEQTSSMLERQVGHLVRLVDDLLDLSRITRNKIELRSERIDLASVLERAIESIRPACDRVGHNLVVTLPRERVWLEGDPVRLTQVFSNLLDNACKYMADPGRVSIVAEILHSDPGVPGEVVVHIKDGGMGIASDQLSRIFDMFAQADTSLERSKSGLGIGLTLVRNLVEMHGGRVEAFSDGEGKGSEFVVRLPIADGPGPASAPARDTDRKDCASRRPCSVLVVDDSRDAAEALALALKLNGHESYIALDGQDALQKAEAIRPDVVLLDLGMPRLNGFDACRLIRQKPWGKSMRLIAQTGWGQEEDRRRTQEAGFDGHLVKPIDPDAMLALLAALPSDPTLPSE